MVTSLAVQLRTIPMPERDLPFLIPWPGSASSGGLRSFERLERWRLFVEDLDLDVRIPLIVRAKFHRALRLLYLAWLDADLIKASELAAMTALELALKDRRKESEPAPFGRMLSELVTSGDLTDDRFPMVARYGGSVIAQINGDITPSLREIRNGLAHGDPFDGLPHAGLLELARDLIEFVYRQYLAESGPLLPRRGSEG